MRYCLSLLFLLLLIACNKDDDESSASPTLPDTCFDFVQNGAEQAVDCGGVCYTCPPEDKRFFNSSEFFLATINDQQWYGEGGQRFVQNDTLHLRIHGKLNDGLASIFFEIPNFTARSASTIDLTDSNITTFVYDSRYSIYPYQTDSNYTVESGTLTIDFLDHALDRIAGQFDFDGVLDGIDWKAEKAYFIIEFGD